MSRLWIYDANGDVTLPESESEGPDAQVYKLVRNVVELYVDPAQPQIVAYTKAKTSLIDHGNRWAYYHVEYSTNHGTDLFDGLARELDGLEASGDEKAELAESDTGTAQTTATQSESRVQSSTTDHGTWSFDKSEIRYAYPWKLPNVAPGTPSLNELYQTAVEDVAKDGTRLSFGMESHLDALRATKHFVNECGCTVAVSGYGRTDGLSETTLVFKPGDYDQSFVALDQETHDAIETKRDAILEGIHETYESDLAKAIEPIIAASDRSILSRLSGIQMAKRILENPDETSSLSTQPGVSELASTVASIESDSRLSESDRTEIYRFGKEVINENQPRLEDELVNRTAKRIEETFQTEIEELVERTSLDTNSAKSRVTSELIGDTPGESASASVVPNAREQTDVARWLFHHDGKWPVPQQRSEMILLVLLLFTLVVVTTVGVVIGLLIPITNGLEGLYPGILS